MSGVHKVGWRNEWEGVLEDACEGVLGPDSLENVLEFPSPGRSLGVSGQWRVTQVQRCGSKLHDCMEWVSRHMSLRYPHSFPQPRVARDCVILPPNCTNVALRTSRHEIMLDRSGRMQQWTAWMDGQRLDGKRVTSWTDDSNWEHILSISSSPLLTWKKSKELQMEMKFLQQRN